MRSLKQIISTWLGASAVWAVACSASLAANPYATPTALQGYLTGHAEIGKGQAAIVTAQAAVIANTAAANAAKAKAVDDLERVKAMALENDVKATKAFYDRRKLYADYQAQHALQRGDAEAMARRAKSSIERATVYQVDPVRGRIFWPSVFKRDEFADSRAAMDSLFARRRSGQSGLGSNFCREATSLAMQMRGDLREMMGDISPSEYIAARRFLENLAFEAQLAPRVEGVAAK